MRRKKREGGENSRRESRGTGDYLADSDEKVDSGVGRGECHQR